MCFFLLLSVFMNVLSEFFAYLSGLRASSGARMGPSARDKGRDAVGQPLLRGPVGLRCTFSKPIGEGLRKCVHTERGRKNT